MPRGKPSFPELHSQDVLGRLSELGSFLESAHLTATCQAFKKKILRRAGKQPPTKIPTLQSQPENLEAKGSDTFTSLSAKDIFNSNV